MLDKNQTVWTGERDSCQARRPEKFLPDVKLTRYKYKTSSSPQRSPKLYLSLRAQYPWAWTAGATSWLSFSSGKDSFNSNRKSLNFSFESKIKGKSFLEGIFVFFLQLFMPSLESRKVGKLGGSDFLPWGESTEPSPQSDHCLRDVPVRQDSEWAGGGVKGQGLAGDQIYNISNISTFIPSNFSFTSSLIWFREDKKILLEYSFKIFSFYFKIYFITFDFWIRLHLLWFYLSKWYNRYLAFFP